MVDYFCTLVSVSIVSLAHLPSIHATSLYDSGSTSFCWAQSVTLTERLYVGFSSFRLT